MVAGLEPAAADTAQPPLPEQILTAVERFRATIPANFDPDYVEKAVIPFFLTSFYEGERPMLPMIDVNLSKENALSYEDFLRKVWRDKIVFRKLNLANPGRVPIGPNAVIQDDLGFSRSA